MKFYSRKLIKPGDLNARNTLFGGMLLKWIDEEASIFVMTRLRSKSIVTKIISEIDFISSAEQGNVIEIGLDLVAVGRTSITVECEVRNLFTKQTIIKLDKIVFVHVDDNERPTPHNRTMEQIMEESNNQNYNW